MVVWFLHKVQDIFDQFPVACGNGYQAETTDYKTFCTIDSLVFLGKSVLYIISGCLGKVAAVFLIASEAWS